MIGKRGWKGEKGADAKGKRESYDRDIKTGRNKITQTMTQRDMRKPAQRQGEASVGGLQNADSLEHLHGKVYVCAHACVCVCVTGCVCTCGWYHLLCLRHYLD